MGRKKSPPPNIIKAPPAKTPTLTQVPTQSLATQTALNEASNSCLLYTSPSPRD